VKKSTVDSGRTPVVISPMGVYIGTDRFIFSQAFVVIIFSLTCYRFRRKTS